MRFTLFAYAPSVLLFMLASLGSHTPATRHDELLIRAAGALLFFAATFAVAVYWIVRLVRRAWRDGSAPAPSEPESGRIFGRLS